MFKFLYVGLGGALGAILRYSFYFLPIPYNIGSNNNWFYFLFY